MTNRRITTLALALCWLLVVSATTSCHRATTKAADSTYEYTDDYDRHITIPAHPTRVVSVSPAITEIIFDLDAEHLLVGRTDYCSYPAAAKDIESIGGISDLNIEKVISLHPDLVICGSMVQPKSADHLEKMGIPMSAVTEKHSFEGLYENIAKIGQLIGYKKQADSLIARLKTDVQTRHHTSDSISHNAPTVYYVVGFGKGGNFTAGGNTFINDIIRMAGGQNMAENISGWSISLEALMDADPDYVIIRREDSAAFCRMPPYNRLTAVRKGRVIGMESGMIDLQVPRNIEAIQMLRRRIGQ